jgi:membrane protein DedA with SNARE-associated domain
MAFLDSLSDAVSATWWSYPLIFAVAFADVLFPVVPSETAVVTAGVLASNGDMYLPLVILLAAAGAAAGDNTAYFLGRHFEAPLRRVFFRGANGARRLAWAERQVARRGGELILVGRFIPGGRTAVTVACGTLEMPWRRFVVLDAFACLLWASYAALLGYLGGSAFEEQLWIGLVVALATAFGVTAAIEAARWILRRRGRPRDASE